MENKVKHYAQLAVKSSSSRKETANVENLWKMEKYTRLNEEDLREVIRNLPEIIRRGAEAFDSPGEQLTHVFASITAAGSLMPKVFGLYHDRRNYPIIFLAVIAPPASNKGILIFSRRLVQKVHRFLKRKSDEDLKAWLRLSKEERMLKAKPPYRIVQIAGDITSAKLIEQLKDNDGGPAIMIEDEIDTIAISSKSEFGLAISRILRNAWHREPISQQRKGDNTHHEVNNPFFAVIQGGTPEQMKKFIGTVENGLYSRFTTLTLDDGPEWQDVSPCVECEKKDDLFENLSTQFFEMWKYLAERDLEIKLTKRQWDMLQKFGSQELRLRVTMENGFLGAIVKRHANMAFRLAMILTTIRFWENEETPLEMYCSDRDFDTAMKLMVHSYECSREFFLQLPGGGLTRSADQKREFYSSLAIGIVKRKDAIAIAAEQGIKNRTADRYLEQFVKCRLLDWLGQGLYLKKNNGELANAQHDDDDT